MWRSLVLVFQKKIEGSGSSFFFYTLKVDELVIISKMMESQQWQRYKAARQANGAYKTVLELRIWDADYATRDPPSLKQNYPNPERPRTRSLVMVRVCKKPMLYKWRVFLVFSSFIFFFPLFSFSVLCCSVIHVRFGLSGCLVGLPRCCRARRASGRLSQANIRTSEEINKKNSASIWQIIRLREKKNYSARVLQ